MNTERQKNHLLWAAPLVTFAGGVSYFTFFARFPGLRDFPWVNLPIVAFGVVLAAIGVRRAFGNPSRFRGKVAGPIGLVFSLALAGLFVFYVFFLSYHVPEPTPTSLTVARMPELSLADQRGQQVDLGAFRGRKVVLAFYRGHW